MKPIIQDVQPRFYGAEHHILQADWCRRCRGDEDRLALYALDAIHKTKRTISEHNFSKFRHFFCYCRNFAYLYTTRTKELRTIHRCTTYQRFVDKTNFYEQIEQVAYWFA